VPIREHPDGSLRLGETRVLLELVVNAFDDGATPEAIVQRYASLRLADVYATIAHCLRHRDEVTAYCRGRDGRAAEVERAIVAGQPDLTEIRRRLLANGTSPGQVDAATGR